MESSAAICQTPHSSWAARCAAALAIGAAYWMIGHSFTHSARLEAESHVRADRVKNQFAAQQGETTGSSAAGFFLLGGVGLACWMTATAQPNWRNGLLWLGIAYLAWCGLSFLWSIDPAQSMRKLAILGLVVAGAAGVSLRFDLEDQVWIAILALGGLVGMGVLAELANGTFRPWRPEFRFSGTCHPNDQGLQCALMAMAAGYAAWTERDRPWLRCLLVAGALGGLWLSKSRTTLVAMLAAVAVAWFLRSRGMQRWLAVSAGAAILSALALGASFSSVAALDQSADIASMGRRQDLNSLTGRLPLWEEMLKAADDRPLLGHGFGAFWNAKNVLKYSREFSWHIPHSHNAYLDMVLETGVIGLVLYLAWVLTTLVVAFVRHGRTGRAALRFAVCLLTFSLVHGLAESKLPGPGIAGFLLLSVMATLAWREASPSLAPAASPLLAPRPRRIETTPRLTY